VCNVDVFGSFESIELEHSTIDSGDDGSPLWNSTDDFGAGSTAVCGDAPFVVAATAVPEFVGYSNLSEPKAFAGRIYLGECGRVAAKCADDATKSVRTPGDYNLTDLCTGF